MIGSVGISDPDLPPHLHFEIRHGGRRTSDRRRSGERGLQRSALITRLGRTVAFDRMIARDHEAMRCVRSLSARTMSDDQLLHRLRPRWSRGRSVRADATSTTRSTSRGRFTVRVAGRHFMASRRSSSKKSLKPTSRKRRHKKAAKKSAKKAAKKTAARREEARSVRARKRPAFNPKTDSANDPNWVAPVWDDDAAAWRARVDRRRHARSAAARPRDRRVRDADLHEDGEPLGRSRVRGRRVHRVSRRARRHARARHDRARFVSHQPRQPRPGAAPPVDRIVRRRAAAMRGARADVSRFASRATTSTIARAAFSATPTRSPKRWRACPGGRFSVWRPRRAAARRSARRSRISPTLIAACPEPLPRARRDLRRHLSRLLGGLRSREAPIDDVWDRFDDLLGMARLRVMHLNDSKTPFDSKRDRHELIGEGSLGELALSEHHERSEARRRAEGDRDAEGNRSDGDRRQDARTAARVRRHRMR